MLRVLFSLIIFTLMIGAFGCEKQRRQYQGKTAKEWAKIAHDRDPATRNQALDALVQIGIPGWEKLEEMVRQKREPLLADLALYNLGHLGEDKGSQSLSAQNMLSFALEDELSMELRLHAANLFWINPQCSTIIEFGGEDQIKSELKALKEPRLISRLVSTLDSVGRSETAGQLFAEHLLPWLEQNTSDPLLCEVLDPLYTVSFIPLDTRKKFIQACEADRFEELGWGTPFGS